MQRELVVNLWRIFQWSYWPFVMPINSVVFLLFFLSSFFFLKNLSPVPLICFLNFWPVTLFYIPSSESLFSSLPFPPVPLLFLQRLSLTLIPWQLLPWVCLSASQSPCGPCFSLFFFMHLLSFLWIPSSLFCLNSLIKWTNTFSNIFCPSSSPSVYLLSLR